MKSYTMKTAPQPATPKPAIKPSTTSRQLDSPAEITTPTAQRKGQVSPSNSSPETLVNDGTNDVDVFMSNTVTPARLTVNGVSARNVTPSGPANSQDALANHVIPVTVPPKILSKALRTELISTMGDLYTSGLVSVASLPQMVLIGDQSSGKSSLISILTGIDLPASSQMTTRGPILCRTLYDPAIETPEIRISVQFLVDKQGKALPQNKVHHHVLHEWRSFGSDVGSLVKEASVMALVPNFNGKGKFTQADPILKGPVQNLEDLEDGMVTENVVTVEVRGNKHEAQELLDYPGIQHNGASHAKIRALIEKQCALPQVSILTCIEANATENLVATLKIRGDLDPLSERSLNVITKCDRLENRDKKQPIWVTRAISEPGKWHFIQPFPTKVEWDNFKTAITQEKIVWERAITQDGPWKDLAMDSLGICNLQPKIAAFMDAKRIQALRKQFIELQSQIYDLKATIATYPAPPPGSARIAVSEQIEKVDNRIHSSLNPVLHFQSIETALELFSTKIMASTIVAIPYARDSADFKAVLSRCPPGLELNQISDVAELELQQSQATSFASRISDFEILTKELARRAQKDWTRWVEELLDTLWGETEKAMAPSLLDLQKSFPLLAGRIRSIITDEIQAASSNCRVHAALTVGAEMKYIIVDSAIATGTGLSEAASIFGLTFSADGNLHKIGSGALAHSSSQYNPSSLVYLGAGGFKTEQATRAAVYTLACLTASAQRLIQWARMRAVVDRSALLTGTKKAMEAGILENEHGEVTTMTNLRKMLEPNPTLAKEKVRSEKKLEVATAWLDKAKQLLDRLNQG